jgi:predicted glycosyltransferase involved in capsule biosynthesis
VAQPCKAKARRKAKCDDKMEMNGFISVITTCKGRLHHLRQTLPGWMAQEGGNYEIIVVDYNDPNDCFSYVESLSDPMVRAVRANNDDPFFNLSKARNTGAMAISEKTDVILFVDADTIMTNNVFINYHKGKVLNPGNFLCGWANGNMNLGAGASGSCMVWRDDFFAVRGYNELANGWGYEDVEFYERLERIGRQQTAFHNGLDSIQHSDEERVMFYRKKNIHVTSNGNLLTMKNNFQSSIA